MARIAGVDVPNKRIAVALTYVYGIGRTTSNRLLAGLRIDPDLRANDLDENQSTAIREALNSRKIEGELRTEVQMNIKSLMDLGNYRGLRHRRKLPVRGQRTKTNARTRKGPRRMAPSGRK